MARQKKNAQTGSKVGDNGMPQFVNCQLTDIQKEQIQGKIPNLKQIMEFIEEMTADNYKLTISFDDTTDCYAVYMIGKENQVTNAGLMLSGYAPVLNGALAVLMYKHLVVMDRDWTGNVANNAKAVWR